MTPAELEYRPLRAPRASGSALIEPTAAEAVALLHGRSPIIDAPAVEISGLSLPTLAKQARRELIQLARDYTFAYRAPFDLPGEAAPIVMAGHQPGLFHPGVWFKNFLLHSVASAAGATPINLIVDNDIVASPAIAVPEVDASGNWNQDRVSFDHSSPPIAWEERTILDRDTFRQFGAAAAEAIRPLVDEPLIESYWPRVLTATESNDNIGRAFAQARHQLEADWGLRTLEIPLSQAYGTESFLRFALRLWHDAPSFRAIYNSAIDEYRQLHKIRSANHPAPHLAQEGELIETPLWIWTKADPRRRGLFVAVTSSGIRLTDRGSFDQKIPGDIDGAISALRELQSEVRLRPRALLTTMYARLILSDLFLHGIGGAKYDQVTDLIIARYFGVTPPQIVAATATVHLPIARTRTDVEQLARIARLMRDLRFNPDRHLGDGNLPEEITQLVDEKERWLLDDQPAQLAQRHRALEGINLALQPYVAPQRAALEQELAQNKREARNDAIAFSREYPFCLFPEKSLRTLLLDLSAAAP
ncbi:hypothetical protein LOC68_16790 [Blastopirellula sp. JC732]|uniref:Uncharacterized protein n=1 Tax=Blastopirellula sediminis TaxID=2894196 RepID=A0A9X1MNK2_9BACT|nr:hypothetical protein [Blastopirellula sediminis]MCC9606652.1 hypothetical protein [Blastopirellula sediminis]MCC9630051.1 hypothetical protein [Blastopirellula sediminis]